VNNTHVKQFTEKKYVEIHLHTAGALQKYNQALELCSRAAFEEVMPRRQLLSIDKSVEVFHFIANISTSVTITHGTSFSFLRTCGYLMLHYQT